MIPVVQNSIKDRIKDKIVDSFWPVRKFFKRLKKIYDYIPLLWKDEDWDYAYLIDMLEYKLKRMSKCIKENEFVEANNRIAKQINYAVYLINRYRNNDETMYNDPEYIRIKKKYGHLDFFKDSIPGVGSMRPKYVKTKAQYESYHNEIFKVYDKYNEREKDTLDRLFKHMRKYLLHWWD